MKIIENRKLLSFQGMIGRKWFFYRSLTAFLIPLGLLLLALLVHLVMGTPGKSISENLNPRSLAENANPLGLTVIIIWMLANFIGVIAFLLVQVSLQVRRGRDIFLRMKSSFWLEAFCVVVFYLTRGFFGLGALALFFWPGLLHKDPDRLIPQAPKAPDQGQARRLFLFLKVVSGIVAFALLGVIALVWMFAGTRSVASGCSSIAIDWIDAMHSDRHNGKFTLGPNQSKILNVIPKFEGLSRSESFAAGAKAFSPIREYLPNFLKTCGEFAKTVSRTCPAFRDPKELGVMRFRLTLAELIQDAQTPVDLEQLKAQELISFMKASHPTLCGNGVEP